MDRKAQKETRKMTIQELQTRATDLLQELIHGNLSDTEREQVQFERVTVSKALTKALVTDIADLRQNTRGFIS